VQQRGLQFRQGFRPQVRSLQALPACFTRLQRQRRAFSTDIKLFTPVWLAARQFRSRAVIAAKMRGVDHRYLLLVVVRQGEKLTRQLLYLRRQCCINAVIDQVEKTDIARGAAEFL